MLRKAFYQGFPLFIFCATDLPKAFLSDIFAEMFLPAFPRLTSHFIIV